MRMPIILVAAAALAACGSSNDGEVRDTDGDGQLSSEEIENQLGGAMSRGEFLEAGEWETNIEVETLEMPGMTADMRDMMKDVMGGTTTRTCLTEAEVAKPDERFFTGGQSDCTYERFSLKDGRIDSEMVCNTQGMRQRMIMSGEYGADSYDLSMKTEGLSDEGISMEMRITANRVGDCEGDAGA